MMVLLSGWLLIPSICFQGRYLLDDREAGFSTNRLYRCIQAVHQGFYYSAMKGLWLKAPYYIDIASHYLINQPGVRGVIGKQGFKKTLESGHSRLRSLSWKWPHLTFNDITFMFGEYCLWKLCGKKNMLHSLKSIWPWLTKWPWNMGPWPHNLLKPMTDPWDERYM